MTKRNNQENPVLVIMKSFENQAILDLYENVKQVVKEKLQKEKSNIIEQELLNGCVMIALADKILSMEKKNGHPAIQSTLKNVTLL